MPRGRQKRVSAGRRYTPTTSSRRSRDRNGPDDAVRVTAVTTDVNNANDVSGAMNRRATTHPCWDVASPANWSASLLRQTIEDRGMKLPSGIKKCQLLRIFLDNFRHSIRR